MGLTFRSTKGSALTHDELDLNFREFIYSASVDGNIVELYKSQSLAEPIRLAMPRSVGGDGYIQLKEGNGPSGSGEFITASKDFRFDYTSSILYVTGTYNHKGNVDVQGDMTVNGDVTAQRFITSFVSSSVSYVSGSNQFGDSLDDSHDFTGRVLITGSQRLTGSATQLGDYTLTGDLNVTGSIAVSGKSNKIRFHFDNTSSLPSATTYHGMFAHTHAEGKAWFAHANNWVELATSESISNRYLKNTTDTLAGDLTVTGTITSNTYIVSSSITHMTQSFSSGSTIFGDSIDDTHIFTGSVTVSSSLEVEGTAILSQISASNHVQIKDAVLRAHSYTNAQTSSITAMNGDFYYNSDANAFIGYQDGVHTAFAAAGAGGLNNIVEDTSPQLGGNLDLNTNNISGSGTVDINGDISGSNILLTGDLNAVSASFTGPISASAINASGDITAFFSSDERLKDNVTPIGSALDKINQIGGYEFDWNSDSEHSGHDVGVIAQEIEKVLPEVVTTRGNGYKAVRYEKIVALLIQALKEQQSQIDDLKSRL